MMSPACLLMATNQYIEMGLLQHTLVIQIFQKKYEEVLNSHRENASSYPDELSSGPIRASRYHNKVKQVCHRTEKHQYIQSDKGKKEDLTRIQLPAVPSTGSDESRYARLIDHGCMSGMVDHSCA
jgi:hypothetical protein